MHRRQFLAAAGLAATVLPAALAVEAPPKRLFTLDLTPGAIGVSADLPEILRLAHGHGFESAQPDGGYLARQDADGLRRTRARLAELNLRWGAAGLPVEFRQSEEAFRKDVAALPRIAAALRDAGVTRIGTWLMPGHNELSMEANMDQHAKRLREASRICADHGLRLGLEYVGTPSLAARFKFPFVRRLPETLELLRRIDVPGTGLVLDSWHWWTAGDSLDALRQVRNEQVVAVDLNDAPAGVALADQQDGRRELPAATGVIPVEDFLRALAGMRFDGPVRAEPFNAPLNALDNEAACARTIEALKKAVAQASL